MPDSNILIIRFGTNILSLTERIEIYNHPYNQRNTFK